jgi:hypothetical protein
LPTLVEGKLEFAFPAGWRVIAYDKWSFYRNQFNCCCNRKAVDFAALDSAGGVLWLIEVKDYRRSRREKDKTISLPDEIGIKVRDTLAGLFAAKVNGLNEVLEFATLSLAATEIRVIFHLEQPGTPSRLFRRAYNPADVQQKLKQLIKPIDPHPRVVETSAMAPVPWQVRSIP